MPNSEDNCPNVANPNQEDIDGDGIGDACDSVDGRSPGGGGNGGAGGGSGGGGATPITQEGQQGSEAGEIDQAFDVS